MRLVECVPNFSEGKDRERVAKILQAISKNSDVHILHVEKDPDVNRSVVTFVGEPDQVADAAYNAIQQAAKLIDMRSENGLHPRIGATDVCPIVPITGVTMQECIDLSHKLAERVARTLSIPVYLYASSARSEDRQVLPFLRKSGFSGLKERMETGLFTPDYGPSEMNATAGATIIGARPPLIAYNIDLDTSSLSVAKTIARGIRRIRDGLQAPVAANLPACTALGWYLPSSNHAQVSINLLDYKRLGMFEIFESVSMLAKLHHVKVRGSELIGLVPKKALIDAGKKFSKGKERVHEHLCEIAVAELGLDSLRPFDWHKRTIEGCLAQKGIKIKDLA